MHTPTKLAAISYFKAFPAQEACGLIVVTPMLVPQFIPCLNVADNPRETFAISRDDYLNAARGNKVIGVCHSHIDSPTFSEADVNAANEYCLPLYMYHLPTDAWKEFVPTTHHVPFEGRDFVWGISDCYSLFRDFHRARGIYVGDYDRDETSTNLGALVVANFAREGFVQRPGVTQFQINDTLVFRTNGSPQHMAMFIGNSKVLHHPRGALSRVDTLNTAWRSRLHGSFYYRGPV